MHLFVVFPERCEAIIARSFAGGKCCAGLPIQELRCILFSLVNPQDVKVESLDGTFATTHQPAQSDQCGMPPVVYAVKRADVNLIKRFIDFGADIKVRGSGDDETVLTAIIERAEPNFIRELVKLRADQP